MDITHKGQRIRESAGTQKKSEAQHYHDLVKAQLWTQDKLKKDSQKTWLDAATRWLSESTHKRSIKDDILILQWLDPYLRNKKLISIDKNLIETIANIKESTGVKPSTVNRMLEIIRAILNKCVKEWDWLNSSPYIRMRKEENKRVRWLTRSEAMTLVNELPEHLKFMAAFTLATGLRESNLTGLKWENVNLKLKHAFIHPEHSKAKKAIPVPLNDTAIKILNAQIGKHEIYVFTYKNKPITRCNNHAWRKALKRAGIKSFRWHDLRHTWASWHVQNGTSLQELQQLGGWSSFNMVLRYAHLSSEHLMNAAEKIHDTNLSQLEFFNSEKTA